MGDPKRTIFVAMIVGGIVTVVALTTGDPSKRTGTGAAHHRTTLWRVGIAWPLATLSLLAVSEVAPQVATGFAGTYALSAILGGRAFADFVTKLLSGKPIRPQPAFDPKR